ncbi:MAG: DUF4465 domain-containing protein [Bacteroidetes bacterium]|nr:DUF4465 domain-containing protein [Bacteroidota bacterium]
MKKTITFLMLVCATFNFKAQSQITTFESFTLAPNSFYKDTNSVPFQTAGMLFRYKWDKPYAYWSGGFSYTNINDTANGNFSNSYNARAGKGYNNSAKYATGKNNAIMVLKAPFNRLDGCYITNTTYAYKSMKNGDQFAKKFGGTSGNDPDFLKVTAKGYFNGAVKADSAVFYLADYRFANNSQDYIVQNWLWFNTTALGQVDSVKFIMYSSDNGQFGINTPTFFSIDDVTVTNAFVGINENTLSNNLTVYPNPFSSSLIFKTTENLNVSISDVYGKVITEVFLNEENKELDLTFLEDGVYFAEIKSGKLNVTKKIIKTH